MELEFHHSRGYHFRHQDREGALVSVKKLVIIVDELKEDLATKILTIIILKSTALWMKQHDVITVRSCKGVRKVPAFKYFVGNELPLLFY